MVNQYSRGGSFLSSIPVVVKNLLIINVLMWVATLVLKSRGIVDLDEYLALHFWKGSDFLPTQFFTYMFMHDTSSLQGGLIHIFCNMFNLWMFGTMLERHFGYKRFLFYYIMCGLGAGLVQEVVWQFTWTNDFFASIEAGGSQLGAAEAEMLYRSGQLNHLVPQFCNMLITVGASGAVFGLLLAFGMTFPNMRMYIIPFPFPIKAKWLVIGYGALELFLGVSHTMSSVAHYAHLGGMLFGIVILLYWRYKSKLTQNRWQ